MFLRRFVPGLVALVCASTGGASAALAADPPEPEGPKAAAPEPEAPEQGKKWRFSMDPPKRVGIETSVLWPFFPGWLLHLKATVPIHKARGEVLVGAQGHIPHDRDEEGNFSSIAGTIGWRQYVIYGLHIDGIFNLGYGRLRDSFLDGADYDSFDAEFMLTAGWRFGVGPLYMAIQPVGIANVFYRSNPWPIEGRAGRPRTEGPIYVGNVLLGVQF